MYGKVIYTIIDGMLGLIFGGVITYSSMFRIFFQKTNWITLVGDMPIVASLMMMI